MCDNGLYINIEEYIYLLQTVTEEQNATYWQIVSSE